MKNKISIMKSVLAMVCIMGWLPAAGNIDFFGKYKDHLFMSFSKIINNTNAMEITPLRSSDQWNRILLMEHQFKPGESADLSKSVALHGWVQAAEGPENIELECMITCLNKTDNAINTRLQYYFNATRSGNDFVINFPANDLQNMGNVLKISILIRGAIEGQSYKFNARNWEISWDNEPNKVLSNIL